MLRLVKTVRDIKLSKSKKEKGGLSNESKEVENESSWSCSSSYGCRRLKCYNKVVTEVANKI